MVSGETESRDAMRWTRREGLATLGAVALTGFKSGHADAATAVDHVMVGVADLAAACDLVMAATGVRPAAGGRHPGLGTHDALASLGSRAYLELIAADPDAPAAQRDGFPAQLRALREATPLAVALAAPGGIAAAVSKLGAVAPGGAPQPGSRTAADGEMLEWTTFDLNPDDDKGFFLIEWRRGRHPGTTAPPGLHLDRLDVTLPNAAATTRQFAALGVALRVAAGAARIAVVVAGPKGRLRLG